MISMRYAWQKYHIRQPVRDPRDLRAAMAKPTYRDVEIPILPSARSVMLTIITAYPIAPLFNLPSLD
jgi:hypothetical protein